MVSLEYHDAPVTIREIHVVVIDNMAQFPVYKNSCEGTKVSKGCLKSRLLG